MKSQLKKTVRLIGSTLLAGIVVTSCDKDDDENIPPITPEPVAVRTIELQGLFVPAQPDVPQEANPSIYSVSQNAIYSIDQLEVNSEIGPQTDFYYDDNTKQLNAPIILNLPLKERINANNATSFKDIGLASAEFQELINTDPDVITEDFIQDKLDNPDFPTANSIAFNTPYKAYAFNTVHNRKGIVYLADSNEAENKATIKMHLVE